MWFSIFLFGSGFVVANGIDKGIEKAMRFLLPMLFVLVFAMVAYGAYAGDFSKGLEYLFSWKAEDGITAGMIQGAIGQAFFSLSIGMGTLMAFGAYMPNDQKVSKASGVVVTADTGVAILAGLAIFPLAFGIYGQQWATMGQGWSPEAGGDTLVFVTLTEAFARLGDIGQFVGPLFFFLLAVAAFSSMISILEPSVAFVSEKFSFTRKKATAIIMLVCFMLSLISVAGHNVWADKSLGTLENPFEMMKYFADDFLLLLVGAGMSIFVGWRLQNVVNADDMGITNKGFMNLWVFVLRWISPVFLLGIWVLGNLDRIFKISFF